MRERISPKEAYRIARRANLWFIDSAVFGASTAVLLADLTLHTPDDPVQKMLVMMAATIGTTVSAHGGVVASNQFNNFRRNFIDNEMPVLSMPGDIEYALGNSRVDKALHTEEG